MANRSLIVCLARMYLGAHYLWGSAGARPGRSDGAWYRTGFVTFAPPSLDLKDCAVFAAQCNASGLYVCAGRYKNVTGGRAAGDMDWDLHHYLDGLRKLPPSAWSPYYTRFTPRRVKGIDVTHKIVWGEDCRGKRHFDCISFINFVLADSMIARRQFDISQLLAATTKEGLDPIDTKEKPYVDGDLLFHGHKHVAFLCANGRVIQAEDHAHGVHENEMYDPTKWSNRKRLQSSLLRD